MSRRLVAALACRNTGSRLYGKPMQNLEKGCTILEHIIAAIRATPEIDDIVLGISEGIDNMNFIGVAKALGVGYILGDEKDVLWRLVQCGRAAKATDVFRVTTECPFPAWELVADVWQRHLAHDNDITVTEFMPEGMCFEIYSLDALEKSHEQGSDADRSEYCSAYARRCHDQFKIEVVSPPAAWRRLDLRVTVDNPEDLALCRHVYRALKYKAPRIPAGDVIAFLDTHPDVTALAAPFVKSDALWGHLVTP